MLFRLHTHFCVNSSFLFQVPQETSQKVSGVKVKFWCWQECDSQKLEERKTW